MKITYIILSAQTPEYLLRCLNSIYRQSAGVAAIIISEKCISLDIGEWQKYVMEHDEIIIVPEEEGNHEVPELKYIPKDSECVLFMESDMVLAPNASDLIAEEAFDKGVLVMPVAYMKKNDFECNLYKSGLDAFLDKDSVAGLCFGKGSFDFLKSTDFKIDCAEYFQVSKYALLIRNIPIVLGGEMSLFAPSRKKIEQSSARLLESSLRACALLQESTENRVVKILLVDYYMRVLIELFTAEIYDSRMEEKAFEALQSIAKGIAGKSIFNRVFESYALCSAAEFLELDCTEYRYYLRILKPEEKRDTGENICTYRVPETSIVMNIPSEIAAHSVAVESPALSAPVGEIRNPVEEVPQLFYEGKLGFKVILRSIKAWMGHKRSK